MNIESTPRGFGVKAKTGGKTKAKSFHFIHTVVAGPSSRYAGLGNYVEGFTQVILDTGFDGNVVDKWRCKAVGFAAIEARTSAEVGISNANSSAKLFVKALVKAGVEAYAEGRYFTKILNWKTEVETNCGINIVRLCMSS